MNYEEVYKEIVDALENKTPFSLIRLGDGEYMTMSGTKRTYVVNRQFGFIPSLEDQEKISEYVKDAYTEADIIGVPTKFHIEECGSYWARAYEYLKEQRPVVKDIETCSIDVHSDLLKSGLLNELLKSQDELICISGRNLDVQFRNKFKLEVNSFNVNAEQMFEQRKSQGHWPYQFDMCLKWIEKTDVKGKLCLVGAGILGKYYSHLLKRQGGIVVEIGHVFDSWAGKHTRGKGRGKDAIDNTYKL